MTPVKKVPSKAAPKSEVSREHHYVPEFYLKQWTNGEGKLWRCIRIRQTGGIHEKPVAPRATGKKSELFSLVDIAPWRRKEKPDVIEREVFGPIDNQAAIVQRRLVGDAEHLTDDERWSWAIFVNSLFERDPRLLAERDQRAFELGVRIRAERNLTACTDDATLKAMASNEVRRHMVAQIHDGATIAYFVSMIWMVVSISEDLFITSDSPLVINGTKDRLPIGMIAMALNPRSLLIMYRNTWELEEELLKTCILAHNLLLLEGDAECLYSSRPIEDGGVVLLRKAVIEHWRRDVVGGQATQAPKSG